MRIEANASRVLVDYEATSVHYDPIDGALPPVFVCVDGDARFIGFANCGDAYHEIKSDDKIFQQKKENFKEGDKIKVIFKKDKQDNWDAVDWEW